MSSIKDLLSLIAKKHIHYFRFVLLGLILVFSVLFFSFEQIKSRTGESKKNSTENAFISSPEILQNSTYVITFEDTNGFFKNETLGLSFQFGNDVFVEVNQAIINPELKKSANVEDYVEGIQRQTSLVVKENTTSREITRLAIKNTPYLKDYDNFLQAAEDTFKYQISSVGQYLDNEKKYSKPVVFKVKDGDNFISAYRYNVHFTDGTEAWVYVPQKHTTEDMQLSRNAVNFIAFQFKVNDEQKMSKILESIIVN